MGERRERRGGGVSPLCGVGETIDLKYRNPVEIYRLIDNRHTMRFSL